MGNMQATAKDSKLQSPHLEDLGVHIKEVQPTVGVKTKVVVHLGNVGDRSPDEVPLEKTLRYSERFKDVYFIGIDLKPAPAGSRLPANVRQIRTDFLTGLRMLSDGSVDIISSEMGLGYYDGLGREYEPTTDGKMSWQGSKMTLIEFQAHNQGVLDYTKEVLVVSYDKLKVGGKINIAVDGSAFNMVKAALDESRFESEKVEVRKFTDADNKRTLWTRQFAALGRTVYQISARK